VIERWREERGRDGLGDGACDEWCCVGVSSQNGRGDKYKVEECMSFETQETTKVDEWLGSIRGESVPEYLPVRRMKFEGEEAGNGKAIEAERS
jgi:hypothetical protein